MKIQLRIEKQLYYLGHDWLDVKAEYNAERIGTGGLWQQESLAVTEILDRHGYQVREKDLDLDLVATVYARLWQVAYDHRLEAQQLLGLAPNFHRFEKVRVLGSHRMVGEGMNG